MFDVRSKPPVVSPLYAPISPNMTQYSAAGVQSPHLSQHWSNSFTQVGKPVSSLKARHEIKQKRDNF